MYLLTIKSQVVLKLGWHHNYSIYGSGGSSICYIYLSASRVRVHILNLFFEGSKFNDFTDFEQLVKIEN